jgi:hypothetical protein
LYNGYLFHEDAENKLYNSAMILYFLDQIDVTNGKIKDLIDSNLKIDYGRIKMLLNKPENIEDLEKIIVQGKIPVEVISRFSIDKIHESQNFLSLLYYMGLVTLSKAENSSEALLVIPNYSIKTMYWEYMKNIISERNPEMLFRPSVIYEGLTSMAFNGDYQPFFEKFHKNIVSQISNRDLENFSEKNVKFLLLGILIQSSVYLPISELENSDGYSDVYLQGRTNLHPKIKNDWIFEFKYIKEADAGKKSLFAAKKKEAREQLQRYKNSNLFKDRTDVRYLAVVFIGKKKYWIEEVITE